MKINEILEVDEPEYMSDTQTYKILQYLQNYLHGN
jgi:hypothetical protein